MRHFIRICLLFGSFLTMPSQAFSADRWIDYYIKQPDEFTMTFMCEDDMHYSIYQRKMFEKKPRARLLEIYVQKNTDGSHDIAELSIKPAIRDSSAIFIDDDVTGFYTFGGYADDNRGVTIWYDFLPEKGVVQYHSMNPKNDRSVSWKAICTRID